jgi:DNA-binding transcriptional MerR regulator
MSTIASPGMTISEAAEASGVSAHTLRYYERAGLLSPVERVDSGHRRYSAEQLEWINFIGCLRATGMPIRRVREYCELAREGDRTEAERLQVLERHRAAVQSDLAELRRNLAAIERKIEIYRKRSEG